MLWKADLDTKPDQLLDVPDVAALLEIRLHDALGCLALQTAAGGMCNQQMRPPRIG